MAPPTLHTINNMRFNHIFQQFLVALTLELVIVFLNFAENIVFGDQNGHGTVGVGQQIGHVSILQELQEFAVVFVGLDQFEKVLRKKKQNLIEKWSLNEMFYIYSFIPELVAPRRAQLDEERNRSYHRQSEPNGHSWL